MSMEITVAKNAGFCFGVRRATESLERTIENSSKSHRIFTLGALIHNDTYNAMLKNRGVEVTSIEHAEELAKSATADSPVTLFIRAHGIVKQDEELLAALHEKYPYFSYVDCTCPFVKKIHKIAAQSSSEDNLFILIGKATHPEVVGIMSYFDYDKVVFSSSEEVESAISEGFFEKYKKKTPIIAAQTTQNLSEWKKTQKIFKKLYTNARFFDTICNVTDFRQKETEALAKRSDVMIVVGGADSSNTAKLYDICKRFCSRSFRVYKIFVV